MTYRSVDASDWIAAQPKSVQEAGESKGQELIRDLTLKEVREAVRRTQVEVAAAMGTSQDRISKIERSDDALVSTLRKHVKALGGELRLISMATNWSPKACERLGKLRRRLLFRNDRFGVLRLLRRGAVGNSKASGVGKASCTQPLGTRRR